MGNANPKVGAAWMSYLSTMLTPHKTLLRALIQTEKFLTLTSRILKLMMMYEFTKHAEPAMLFSHVWVRIVRICTKVCMGKNLIALQKMKKFCTQLGESLFNSCFCHGFRKF